jgi:hypothetical protein
MNLLKRKKERERERKYDPKIVINTFKHMLIPNGKEKYNTNSNEINNIRNQY